MKTCYTCNRTKPVAAFARRAQSPDGLARSCRLCAESAPNARGTSTPYVEAELITEWREVVSKHAGTPTGVRFSRLAGQLAAITANRG